ncbi:Single hybrid motif superfamily protein [Hibiscus syriacus]|uniref:Single hybrid motif superfamily protein n=1 Tax=Hibiscus syriacus TaxID=106335 RepID=A0A6A3A872_HIBSY|nr:Single hybrid motif superfamily protein [Hibiscus syriacus]
MSRPGDWSCRSCQHLNFQRRDSCQRCGEFRSSDNFGGFGGGRGDSSFGFTIGSDVRPGNWYCTAGSCGTHNFASRSSCFKCGAFKDDSAGGFDCDVVRLEDSVALTEPGGNPATGYVPGEFLVSFQIRKHAWGMSGCNEHNFASRMECFRCSAPRDMSNATSY